MLIEDFEKNPFGTVFCADGDGFWTVLIVQAGEEHRDIVGTVDDVVDSPYGFGWEKAGNASHEGAYFFNQAGLVGSVLVERGLCVDRSGDLKENKGFMEMVLAMAEMRMQAEDPGMFEYLSSKQAVDRSTRPTLT